MLKTNREKTTGPAKEEDRKRDRVSNGEAWKG